MINSRIPLRRLQASLVIILLLGFIAISESLLQDWQALAIIGAGLITLCVIIRTLSSIYIASYKNVHLVTRGPYSISRNPLYLSWVCGAVGMGFALHSILLAILLGIIIFLIYNRAILLEEDRLSTRFPEEWSEYARRTPRWFGINRSFNFRLSHSPSLEHSVKSFFEGASLYLVYPFKYLAKTLQASGDLLILLFYL